MTGYAWESFITRLLNVGVNAAAGLIRIALLIVLAYALTRLLRAGLNRLEILLIRATEKTETIPGAASKRIKTLTGVLWTIGCGLLWFVVVLVAFSQVGFNIGPLLAGAGVAGLAVGFGAQHLVRDLVSGFFLLLENQIRIGDTAIVNGTGGLVEAITFRTVVLRDQAGLVHVFPNGSINTLANATKDWSASVVDVTLPYRVDTDRVMGLMRQVGEAMAQDAEYAPMMLEPVEIFGVENFTDTTVTIRARLKTQPSMQHRIGREFRRRLKYALQAAEVDLTAPLALSKSTESPRP